VTIVNRVSNLSCISMWGGEQVAIVYDVLKSKL
jgi:hypothetical protein